MQGTSMSLCVLHLMEISLDRRHYIIRLTLKPTDTDLFQTRGQINNYAHHITDYPLPRIWNTFNLSVYLFFRLDFLLWTPFFLDGLWVVLEVSFAISFSSWKLAWGILISRVSLQGWRSDVFALTKTSSFS